MNRLDSFVLRADTAAVQAGTSGEVRGAPAVAETFAGRARAARPALVNGAAGLVWAPGGRPRFVFSSTIEGGKITAIRMVTDPRTCAASTSQSSTTDPLAVPLGRGVAMVRGRHV